MPDQFSRDTGEPWNPIRLLVLYPRCLEEYRRGQQFVSIGNPSCPLCYTRNIDSRRRFSEHFHRLYAAVLPALDGSTEVSIAVRYLENGGVVVVPTDTLYALTADVFSLGALERVFAIKLRPSGLALPVLVGCWDQVELVARDATETARQLADHFWPGPLTLILPKATGLPDQVTGGGDTVAVRMPDHHVPLAITRELGKPITGTSANRSGQRDLLTLEAIKTKLGGEVDLIMRSGPPPGGIPSTVIDVTSGNPRLVRAGALDFDEIVAVCG